MKIALAAFGLESSTFTPIKATLSELFVSREKFASPELLAFCAREGIELAQVFMVGGSPSGCIENSAFESLRDELLQRLKGAGPIDGLMLSMHGSMLREDLSHGELEVLRAIRRDLGPDLPISVRLDLHGNIPEGFVDLADCYTALRTAPHRDYPETMRRGLLSLKRIINEKLKTHTRLVRLPLLFTGEMVVTESEPAKSLYRMIDDVEQDPDILAASIMVGFAWADVPFAGGSTIVTARSAEKAQAAAQVLADEFWRLRAQFKIDGETCEPEELASIVESSGALPIFASDSGDNITAGSTGDDVSLLKTIIDAGVSNFFYAQFFDPESVSRCIAAGEGAEVEIALGGKVGRGTPAPLYLKGTVEKISKTDHGQVVIFRFAQNQILIQEKRIPYPKGDITIFSTLGVELMSKNLCVFKFGYLMPELRDAAPRGVIVLNSGPTALDIHKFSYTRVRRPIFPLDRID